jgi:hypothetical protein
MLLLDRRQTGRRLEEIGRDQRQAQRDIGEDPQMRRPLRIDGEAAGIDEALACRQPGLQDIAEDLRARCLRRSRGNMVQPDRADEIVVVVDAVAIAVLRPSNSSSTILSALAFIMPDAR